ncbi:HAMP domain-containing histidine kinase [Persicimonas caeni]|uniref:HAMP domain-containing histidine kinase n=1 Tax=Persicimonas caeni TaxID=2292766 RepID=A0A4Y6PYX4_PERCE|nr:histidine kinase dimerization/phospho-acceptor domain-containing protein [Persicimonas caeni]QDG53521.1 HAMP domain-containing histidine kinase [Persicimonas caeni]QED34742.1 HAMP domain-containing histidine kinase [Persicimonas caeni]
MTDERNNDSLRRNTTDRMTLEECPTLEIPESERQPCVEEDTPPTDEWIRDEKVSDSDEWDDRPSTIRMGWAKRERRDEEESVPAGLCSSNGRAPADDTNPEMLIWQLDDEPESLRTTVRDEQALERTQIIDMERVLEMDRVLAPIDDDMAMVADEHALTDLAGAVGHELNNPLTTCVGYLRQLSAMVPHDDDKMALMVDRLGRNLNRIHSIVSELEMLAAESSGHSERVNLADAVERVHDQLGSFLNAHVELQLRPAYLRTDRPRLYQLVYIMLAAYMLDSEGDNHCSVRVSSRSVGACLEIVAPRKPRGSLRLDLLGILRRNTLDGSTPLGLAAELTREMGGSWSEAKSGEEFRVTAVLPRQSPNTASKGEQGQQKRRPNPASMPSQDWSKTSPGSHWRSAANRFVTLPRSRR